MHSYRGHLLGRSRIHNGHLRDERNIRTVRKFSMFSAQKQTNKQKTLKSTVQERVHCTTAGESLYWIVEENTGPCPKSVGKTRALPRWTHYLLLSPLIPSKVPVPVYSFVQSTSLCIFLLVCWPTCHSSTDIILTVLYPSVGWSLLKSSWGITIKG